MKNKKITVTFPINPDIGPPPLKSPIMFEGKEIGKVIKINGNIITASISDKENLKKFLKPKETFSMGCKIKEEID